MGEINQTEGQKAITNFGPNPPDPLPEYGVRQRGHGPRDVAGDGEVGGEGHLHGGPPPVVVVAVVIGEVVVVVHRHGRPRGEGDGAGGEGDVAELKVPEGGHGDKKVPRHHGAHAEVAEGEAKRQSKTNQPLQE